MNYLIAFSGGILAFFSPCFLPLIPAYLIYFTGLSLAEVRESRSITIIHSILFVIGFTIVFTALGVAASAFGQFFSRFAGYFRVFSGIILIGLGMYLLGILKLAFLDLDRKIALAGKPAGYIGTIIIGMVFAIGWTPCIGPILAGILVLASQAATAGQGALLLIAFSLGMGLPLLLVSLAVDYSLSLLKKVEKHLGTIHSICGILLVILGLLMLIKLF